MFQNYDLILPSLKTLVDHPIWFPLVLFVPLVLHFCLLLINLSLQRIQSVHWSQKIGSALNAFLFSIWCFLTVFWPLEKEWRFLIPLGAVLLLFVVLKEQFFQKESSHGLSGLIHLLSFAFLPLVFLSSLALLIFHPLGAWFQIGQGVFYFFLSLFHFKSNSSLSSSPPLLVASSLEKDDSFLQDLEEEENLEKPLEKPLEKEEQTDEERDSKKEDSH